MLLQSERREKTLSVIEPPVLHRVGTTNTGSPNDQPGQDFPPPPHIQDAHRPERGGVQAAPSGLRAGLGVRPGPPGRGAGVAVGARGGWRTRRTSWCSFWCISGSTPSKWCRGCSSGWASRRRMGKCFEVGSACGISKKEIGGESKNEIVSSGFFQNL